MPYRLKKLDRLSSRRRMRNCWDHENWKALFLMAAMLLALFITTAQKVAAADFLPRDGVWQGQSSIRSVAGCTEELRADIQAEVRDELLYSSPMKFTAPFSLDQFNGVFEADVQWDRKGPNLWTGTYIETEKSLFGSITSKTRVETQVLSDNEISQNAVVTISFSRALAAKLGTTSPCVVDMDVAHRRVGP